MPTDEESKTLKQAIEHKDSAKIRELLQQDSAKKLLLMKDDNGLLPIHYACWNKVDEACVQLILDAAVEHGIIKKMLEEKANSTGFTCLHFSCLQDSSPNSLRLLLEYSSKHTDIKKMLEKNNNPVLTCIHLACYHNLSPDSFRLLISFFPSNESFKLVLASKVHNRTPLDLALTDECKQLLQDPDCWRECRYWLLRNYRETFLNSLYPNSPEKTIEALQEVNENYYVGETLEKVMLHQQNLVNRLHVIPDESAARQALELTAMSMFVLCHEAFHRDDINRGQNAEFRQLITDVQRLNFAVASHITLYDDESTARHGLELEALSTTEDFHRNHINKREHVEVRQLIADFQKLKPLSEEEFDRQELEKFIYDRLPMNRLHKEAISMLVKNGITVETFLLLTVEEFREMSVQIGPRLHFLQIIEQEKSLRQQQSLTARNRSDVDALAAAHQSISSRHHSSDSAVPHLNFSLLQQAAGVPPVSKPSEDHHDEVRSFVPTEESTELVSVNGGATNSTSYS